MNEKDRIPKPEGPESTGGEAEDFTVDVPFLQEEDDSDGEVVSARVLEARAKALAQEEEKREEEGTHLEVVEFVLAQEKYALELDYIREVYPLKDQTPIPCTPPFVFGAINVRGQILSIIDLRVFFDLPQNGISDLTRVIILHNEDMEFGILADVILGVRSIPEISVQAALPTLSGIRSEYLKGVTGDRVAILHGGKLLADQKIVFHEEVKI